MLLLRFSLYLSSTFFANAEQCASNPSGISYDVDWGSPSSSTYTSLTCLTITNDQPYERREVAFSGIPVAQDLGISDQDLERLVLVGANNKRIPAQFNILSRWGGALTDTSKRVRWVQVAIPLLISPSATSTLNLRYVEYHVKSGYLSKL